MECTYCSWHIGVAREALALNPLLGAIAAGNAAVLKCSENAPSVSALIAKLVPLYLDSRAIRVVEGGIPESEELLKQKWEKIFFTGVLFHILAFEYRKKGREM